MSKEIKKISRQEAIDELTEEWTELMFNDTDMLDNIIREGFKGLETRTNTELSADMNDMYATEQDPDEPTYVVEGEEN